MLTFAEPHERLASQRVRAEGSLTASIRDGRTHIVRLYQEGAAKIRLPRRSDGAFEAVLINTAGGLTGGDRLRWSADIGAGATATLTTQACEKIYRSTHGTAELTCRLSVGRGGRVAWLPQETILFERSALTRRLDVDLGADAEAVFAEATLFGRRAMGERVERASFRDSWRIRQGGRLIHAEEFAIGPEVSSTLHRSAVLDGAAAMATVLAIGTEVGNKRDAARDIIGDAGGASCWRIGRSGKLLARLVAPDGYALRKSLVPLLRLLNGEAGLPKIWSS